MKKSREPKQLIHTVHQIQGLTIIVGPIWAQFDNFCLKILLQFWYKILKPNILKWILKHIRNHIYTQR